MTETEIKLKIKETVEKLTDNKSNIDIEIDIMYDLCVNYMNVDLMPTILINIVSRELVRNIETGYEGEVKKVKEGDTEIEYDISGVGEATFYNIQSHLQKHRRIKVI